MKKLLFLLIALSSLGKALVADMDTDGVIGRDMAQDIQTFLDKDKKTGESIRLYSELINLVLTKIDFKHEVNQRVEKIKNEYYKDSLNELALINDILLSTGITVDGKPLIDQVNKLVTTVKEINKCPDGLNGLSWDEIRNIDRQIFGFESEIKRVSKDINGAAKRLPGAQEIVNQQVSAFTQKKIARIKKIQEEQQKNVQEGSQPMSLDIINRE